MEAFVATLLKAGLDWLAGLIIDIINKNPGLSEKDLIEKIKQAQTEGNAGKWLDDLLKEKDAEFQKP